jgi:hypothetical protein
MFYFWLFIVAGLLPACFILSSRINDGVIIKSGLILVSIGFFGVASAIYEDLHTINPFITSWIGFCIVTLGFLMRVATNKSRRLTDWLNIEKPKPKNGRRANETQTY